MQQDFYLVQLQLSSRVKVERTDCFAQRATVSTVELACRLICLVS